MYVIFKYLIYIHILISNFLNRINKEKAKIKITNGIVRIILEKDHKKRRIEILNEE